MWIIIAALISWCLWLSSQIIDLQSRIKEYDYPTHLRVHNLFEDLEDDGK